MSSESSDDQVEAVGELKPIPLISSAVDYPTVYADGCMFATRLGSCVRITFYETVMEASDSISPGAKNRHVGTLVLPVEGYAGMLKYLNDVTPKFIFPERPEGG